MQLINIKTNQNCLISFFNFESKNKITETKNAIKKIIQEKSKKNNYQSCQTSIKNILRFSDLSKEEILVLAKDVFIEHAESYFSTNDDFLIKILIATCINSEEDFQKCVFAILASTLNSKKTPLLLQFCTEWYAYRPDNPEIMTHVALEMIKASETPEETEQIFSSVIDDFGISDLESQKKIALACTEKNPDFLRKHIQSRDYIAELIAEYGKSFVKKTTPITDSGFDSPVQSSYSVYTFFEVLGKVRNIAKQFFSKKLPCTDLFPEENSSRIRRTFEILSKYRNKEILLSLFEKFTKEILSSKSSFLSYNTLIGSKHIVGAPVVRYKTLPSIYPSVWLTNGWMFQSQKTEMEKKFSEFLESPKIKKALNNCVSFSLMQNLLQAEIALDQDASLSFYNKLFLLTEICRPEKNPEEIASALFLLTPICKYQNGKNLLSIDFSKNYMEKMREVANIAFQKNCYADLSGIPDLELAYQKTFGSGHIPHSLLTYEGSLSKSKEVKIDFTRFVRSVLLGRKTFLQERYRTDNNPNLQSIAEKDPSGFEIWKQSLPPVSFNNLIIEDTDDAVTIFEAPTIAQTTCQSLDVGDLNRSLISFCMDGGIRMLTAKNEEGKTVAFCLLRILRDENNNTVMILEKSYGSPIMKNLRKTFENLATEKARRMGCPLFSQKLKTEIEETDDVYKGSFVWAGGNCYYSYLDLIGIELSSSKMFFTVPDLIKLSDNV